MDSITLRDYQEIIINDTIEYFKNNDKTLLNMCCGAGKTITSLSIAKNINVNKLLVLAPSCILVNQWANVIKNIFPDKSITFYKKKLKNFDILITTYHNSLNVKLLNYNFDLIILDECHHLTGEITNIDNERNIFLHSLFLNSKKQLGLSATMKRIKNNDLCIDNYSTEHFGDIIANYCIKQAIENNIITDFNIQLLIINDDNIFKYIDNIENVKLYYSSYMALYNLSNNISSNILIYANKIKNADIIEEYINILINLNIFEFKTKVNILKCTSNNKYDISNINHNELNILCSVYSLGEGYDLPLLDTVIFSENMKSCIRIIQSMLRPCRKYINKKMAIITLPIICTEYIALKDEFKKISQIFKSIYDFDANICEYYISKITCHELVKKDNKSNKNKIINHDSNMTDQFIKNIILSKNNFNILNDDNINFLDNDFCYAKITKCILNNVILSKDKLKAFYIILYLYKEIINDQKFILKNTTFSRKTLNVGKHIDTKIYYIESLNIFLKKSNLNNSIREIIKLCLKLEISIELEIKLKDNKIISYNN